MRGLFANRVVVATALLPLLLGSLALWSLSDRVERMDSVPAAVVNLDEPVRTGTGEERQIVAAGRLLAAGLTASADAQDQPLDWRLTTAEDAEEGLRSGRFYAVITIPEDFSRTVAGLTRNDPETARITVVTNDAASALVGEVGDQIGDVAAARLNQQITTMFLEGVYAQTGELKSSLGEAERGAGRIADGAARLGQGTTRLSAGAGELAGGLTSLSGGAGQLAAGADRLAAGARRLSSGTARLHAGAGDLADGAGELGAGLGTLHARTRPLPDQTRRLADGADRLAQGVDGWAQVLRGWKQACQSDPILTGSHARLCAATIQAVGVTGDNADAMVAGSRSLASGADRLADGTPALVSAVGRAADGADRLAAGAGRLATGARKVDAGTERLASGAGDLAAGADRLADGAVQARTGASALADGSTRVASGTERLSSGSRALAAGLGEGAERIPSLGPEEREDLAATVAQPVVSDTDRLNEAPSTATALAPGVVALALWIGAFVSYLVRRALPARALAGATTPFRVALAGWLPAAAVGVVQSVLLLVGLAALDVAMASPAGLAVFLLVTSAVFAAINQALLAALGRRRGWMASIVLVVLQAVSLGGVVPVDTAPEAIRVVSGVLPVSLAAEGVGDLTLGGEVGSAVAATVALAAWAVLALAVTTLAARRHQRLSLSDIRRQVAAAPA